MKTKRFKLKEGSEVLFRLYNTPDRKFYGEVCRGIVTGIDKTKKHPYEVAYNHPQGVNWFTFHLDRKEIMRVLS